MQFFPDSVSFGVSALGGVELRQSEPGQALAKANAFLESLNQELAALGVAPVTDAGAETGPPKGFRTIKRDLSAALDNDDIKTIVDKLRKRGTPDSALAGIEGLLNKDVSPTIGSIMSAIRGKGRATGDLTDEELQELTGVLQKLGCSQEESDELMGLMQEGKGFEALRILKAKAAASGEGSVGLTAREAGTLARGLDISPGAVQKIAGLFSGGADAEGTKALGDLLGPITEDIATRQAEREKMAAEFQEVIKDALREKKEREQNSLVADTRGNGQSERAEKRMRDDLTAKANGFGKTVEERREEERASAEEEEAWDRQRENARREAPAREKTVALMENSRDGSAASPEKTQSQLKSDFTPLLSRMDASPDLTMSAQNQAPASAHTAATPYAQQREIFSQVEQGFLRQLADGSRQMTLQLNPAELGNLTLVLSVKSGEVKALIRAENPETTALLADQMDQIRASLEEQGLKVAQLDVETQLPGDTTQNQWSEADMAQYNKEQEMREQARFARLAKLRQESGTSLAHNMQSKGMREENAASGIQPGLHLIA